MSKKKPFMCKVREPPSMFPYRVSMERDASSPEPVFYLFIYICWSPQKEALP
jgi:hypothetical protein